MLGVIAIILLILLAGWLLTTIGGSLFGIIVTIAIWAITGWLVGRLVSRDGKGYGALMNIGLGLVGGIVGSVVLNLINLQGIADIWLIGNILVGVIGGLVVVLVARLFNRNAFR